MIRTFALIVVSAILAGCAAHERPGRRLDPQIAQAVQESSTIKRRPGDIDSVQAALLPPLTQPLPPSAAKALEPRFDLSVNNAPASQVFLSIASGTRYSMIVHPDASGPISISLKDVTVLEALQSIREIYGYDFRIDGSRIFILPASIQTRVFQVNYLMGQRLGRSDLRVTSGSIADAPAGGTGAPQPGGAAAQGGATAAVSDSSRIQTTIQNDFWNDLAITLNIVLGCQPRAPRSGLMAGPNDFSCTEGRSVIVNPQAGVVVVRGMPTELRNVESYLRAIRTSVERQVMLEAKIIEVTLSEQYQAGVNWAAFPTSGLAGGIVGPGTALGVSGTLTNQAITGDPASRALAVAGAAGTLIPGVPGGALFGLAFQTRNFAALLQFLEAQGTVQVLSSPRVAAMNNQKAVLKVGTDDFFITNVSGSATVSTTAAGSGAPAFPTLTLRPFFSGVALDVTPQIDEDSNIILHIHPSVSNVRQQDRVVDLGTAFGGRVTLPLASSTVSESDSVVKVGDGNIVAIGGLMKIDIGDTRSGLPGLQDEPYVGGAFGSKTRTMVKKELVILIKPTVIQSDRDFNDEFNAARERLLGGRQGR